MAILPDMSRRCPEVDPDDHHLYASLGSAAENLLLAAQAAGRHANCAPDPATSRIRVVFEDAPARRSALLDAIVRRQCSHTAYDGTPLSRQELSLLEKARQGNGVSVMLLTDSAQMEQLAEYVAAGNRA